MTKLLFRIAIISALIVWAGTSSVCAEQSETLLDPPLPSFGDPYSAIGFTAGSYTFYPQINAAMFGGASPEMTVEFKPSLRPTRIAKDRSFEATAL